MTTDAAASLCRYLNELAALDRRAMYRQVRTFSPCNDAVWYRLTERRVVTSDVGAMLGMLGLLNGWLAESGVRIIVNLDRDEGIVTGFDLEGLDEPSETPAGSPPADTDAPAAEPDPADE